MINVALGVVVERTPVFLSLVVVIVVAVVVVDGGTGNGGGGVAIREGDAVVKVDCGGKPVAATPFLQFTVLVLCWKNS